MNQKMIAKVLASALLGAAALASTSSFAADEKGTATLTVTGKLTPGACTVSFVGGGSIDYGDIAAASLSSSAYTALTEKTKSLSVACGSLTNAYVSVTDSRSANVINDAPMQTALGGAEGTQLYGLGTTNGGKTNIGAYTIKMGPATTTDLAGTSTTQAAVLSSTDKSTWSASSAAVFMTAGGATYYSTGASAAGSTPVQAKTFAFPLTVKAALNNTTNMPVTSNVALDGLATFTVAYN
jgi:type 1 fimbria pilin